MRISPMTFIVLSACMAGSLFGDAKRPADSEIIDSFIRDALISQNTNSTDWAFMIEDSAVPMDELRTAYQRGLEQFAQNPQGQPVDSNMIKREIFNNTLLSSVIVRKALDDKLFQDAEARANLRLALRQAVVQIYLAKLAPKDTNRFVPTREEISDFYNRNRERFDQSQASADQIKGYIINQLSAQKLQLWVTQQMDKAKEQYRIKRNEQLLTNEGFN